jgi:predicted porin
MNKKLIAVAVASTLAAPAVYAEGHTGITPYGRINNAIDYTDQDDDSTWDISGVASRFGFKGVGDIGNGLTAIGRYEFSTSSDREQPGIGDIRLAYVGLSGGFGTVTMGNQWSAYYNSIGTHLSPTYSVGYYLYSSIGQGPFRASNTIKYANSFGPVNMEIDVRLNDSGEDNDVAEKLNGNGLGLGLSWNVTDAFNLAFAVDQEENNPREDGSDTPDTDRYGIAGKFTFGVFDIIAGYQKVEDGDARRNDQRDIDHTQLYFNWRASDKTNLLLGYGQAEVSAGLVAPVSTDPKQWFLGAYHNLGGGLRLYAEYASVDYDSDNNNEDFQVGDLDRLLLGMRIDF